MNIAIHIVKSLVVGILLVLFTKCLLDSFNNIEQWISWTAMVLWVFSLGVITLCAFREVNEDK